MRKFRISVTEKYRADYIVEANSVKEAEELFGKYIDGNLEFEEMMYRDLERGFYGMDIAVQTEVTDEDVLVDISYKELKGEDANEK